MSSTSRNLAVAVGMLAVALAACSCARRAVPGPEAATAQTYLVKGVVKELQADGKTVVVSHEAVGDYMAAMTMPFRVKESRELRGLRPGDTITFRLRVTGSESWIEGIARIEGAPPVEAREQHSPGGVKALVKHSRHPLMDYKFTNELGQAVSLGDFRGQALAITFFFTRCPLPEFCPRLSKNFQEAEEKLSSMAGAPTNWHFLSVSFDPEHDTPEVLKAYGQMYKYDAARWSFITGPTEKVDELARLSEVTYERSGGTISHNFRTLIIDARGRLQMIFPMGGDFSSDIVSEILKAAGARDEPRPREPEPLKPPPSRVAAVMPTVQVPVHTRSGGAS